MLKSVFLKSLSVLFIVSAIQYLSLNEAFAQIYYVSDDTLWVQENSGENPRFIAEGSSLPIRSATVDTSAGFIYWSQEGAINSEIYRADLDSLESELIAESPAARGITVDTVNNKIYWADLSNDGSIYRANTDGTGTEVLVAGESDGVTNGILDIDLDVANEKMYWVKSGAVMSADLNGSDVTAVVEMATYIQPTGLVLDVEAGYVYWTDSSNDEIRRVALNGDEIETVADADSPAAIDLDEAGGKIYWVEDYLFSGQGGAIYRSNEDGSSIELVKDISFTRNALHVTGWSIPTSAEEERDELPELVTLKDNYPNPFNPQTVIRYELAEPVMVSLSVYNFLGQKVGNLLLNEMKAAGIHEITFNASRLPSGIYFYQIKTEAGSHTKKMTLIK